MCNLKTVVCSRHPPSPLRFIGCADYRIFPAEKLDSIKIEANKENYEVKSYEKS
jgi:hypothetical protein